jgi:hypothetical protein
MTKSHLKLIAPIEVLRTVARTGPIKMARRRSEPLVVSAAMTPARATGARWRRGNDRLADRLPYRTRAPEPCSSLVSHLAGRWAGPRICDCWDLVPVPPNAFTTAGFARMIERTAAATGIEPKAHPHMLRHACGYALTRAMTRGLSRRGSAIARSPGPRSTRRWRRTGSRTSGGIEVECSKKI